MLNYVSAFRERFQLRINTVGSVFTIKDPFTLMWRPIGNAKFGSNTAVITGSYNGERISFASLETIHQVVFVADTTTNSTIGRIEIATNGAIQVYDNPVVQVEPGVEIDRNWKHHITAIIGVQCPTTINITDELGADTDILRLKDGHATWFVPSRYKSGSPAYDFMVPDATEPIRPPRETQAGPSSASTERRQTPATLALTDAQRWQLLQPGNATSGGPNPLTMPPSSIQDRLRRARLSPPSDSDDTRTPSISSLTSQSGPLSSLRQRLLLPRAHSVSNPVSDDDDMPELEPIQHRSHPARNVTADTDSLIEQAIQNSLLDQPTK